MQKSIGNWDLGSPIGSGAMGAVYHCRNRLVDIQAALKRIPLRTPTALARFKLEVEALHRLGHHPHLVRLVDFGVFPDNSAGWIVMEYVDGDPLPAQMDEANVLELLVQVGGALAHAHAYGIAHRDVKPSNILRTPRGFVLLDFGVAREQHATRLTELGAFVGTLDYSPPELSKWGPKGTDDGQGWDIYALGQIAYELLIGSPAVPRKNGHRDLATVLLHKKDTGALDPSSACSEGLAALIRQATAPHPQHRISSVEELAARAAALRAEANLLGNGSEWMGSATSLPVVVVSNEPPSAADWEAPVSWWTFWRNALAWGLLGALIPQPIVAIGFVAAIVFLDWGGTPPSEPLVAVVPAADKPIPWGESPDASWMSVDLESAPAAVTTSDLLEAPGPDSGPTGPPPPAPEIRPTPPVPEARARPTPAVSTRPLSTTLDVDAKTSLEVDEPFNLRVRAQAAREVSARMVLSMDGKPAMTKEVLLTPQERTVMVHTRRWSAPGTHQWRVDLDLDGGQTASNRLAEGTAVVAPPVLTSVGRAPALGDHVVVLVASDGSTFPVAPSTRVVPGRYELQVKLGSRAITSSVTVGRDPVVVSCSIAMICALK